MVWPNTSTRRDTKPLCSTEQVEINVLFFLLGTTTRSATSRGSCDWSTATTTAAKFLQLLLAFLNDFMDCLSCQLRDQCLGELLVVLCVDRLQYLLDVLLRWAIFACESRHQVSCNVLESHDC